MGPLKSPPTPPPDLQDHPSYPIVAIMNRPSRNDDTEDHPDWNQSPHSLSADLTTRADLNGIVNLREQRENDSSLDNSEQEQINIRPLDTPEPPSSSNKPPAPSRLIQEPMIISTRLIQVSR